MKTKQININELDGFNLFQRAEIGREAFNQLIRDILGQHKEGRMLIQSDYAGDYNATSITFDVKIEYYDIITEKDGWGKDILTINRYNYNNGTCINLDLSAAKMAHITVDKDPEDMNICIQVDGQGLWFEL